MSVYGISGIQHKKRYLVMMMIAFLFMIKIYIFSIYLLICKWILRQSRSLWTFQHPLISACLSSVGSCLYGLV